MHNCEQCRKGIDQIGAPGDWPTCEIEAALTEAYGLDGTVTEAIALRMGHSLTNYSWQCGEFEEGPPPPTPDGRIKVAEAWQMDGYIFNPWMLFKEGVAVAHSGPLQLRSELVKGPGEIFRQANEYSVDVAPQAIYTSDVLPDAVMFRADIPLIPTQGFNRLLPISLKWLCQLYEANMTIWRSVTLPSVYVVLREFEPVGVVMGIAEFKFDLYRAIWAEAGGAT